MEEWTVVHVHVLDVFSFSSFGLLICYTYEALAHTNSLVGTVFTCRFSVGRKRSMHWSKQVARPLGALVLVKQTTPSILYRVRVVEIFWCTFSLHSHMFIIHLWISSRVCFRQYYHASESRRFPGSSNTLISLYIILQVVQCLFRCCKQLWL